MWEIFNGVMFYPPWLRLWLPPWLWCNNRINGWLSGRWAPREIPAELRDEYTLGGEVPVVPWYLNDIKSGDLKWTTRSIWWQPERIRQRKTAYYGKTDTALYDALDRHSIRGKELVIVGSQTPWYECIATQYGAAVTTIEYRRVACEIPGLTVMTPDEFAAKPRLFDAALSISSIEHDGLGRYGDPLDPNGDLRAMADFKRLLKPGGILFLSVPVGLDAVVWNAHRVFGRKRLPRLLEGWRTLGTYDFQDAMLDLGPLGGFDNQPVLVLTPQ
jgi:SAM-dependent methyltransferase